MRMLRDSSIVCRTSRFALPMINMVGAFLLLQFGFLSFCDGGGGGDVCVP